MTAEDLFDSFLDGLGISRVELHPAVNRPELMMTAGLVLREFVKSTISLLATRSNLKNAFRLDQTTVLPRHNNPLKLAENTRDSMMQLLVGQEGGQMDFLNTAHMSLNQALHSSQAALCPTSPPHSQRDRERDEQARVLVSSVLLCV